MLLFAGAMNDTELARRCAGGDPSAWDELVGRHVEAVFRAVARVLGGDADAEDVVQTVFLKLLDENGRRLRTYQGRSRLSTWLVAVARREALDHLERRKRPLPAPPGTRPLDLLVTELKDDPALRSDGAEASRRLEAAMDRLPARDGLLVRLVCVDGASYEEAARFLAVPLNSISPWLGRAKERLRALLGEKVYGAGPSDPQRGGR